MYLERICRKHGKKRYVSTLIRESYRDKGKVKHRTLATLSKLPANIIKGIEALLSNAKTCLQKLDGIEIKNSREYGASNAFMNLAKQLKLDKIIYSRKTRWRQDILAMIVGRVIYQGSKLHLTHLYRDSILWELAGFKGKDCPDVTKHCYEPLDKLLARQKVIQAELAKKHLKNSAIILYDITSSYLEGVYKNSKLVEFGYSRDQKRGHEQIVIGLLANENGCPVAVEVFRGNTSDQATVLGQAKKLANDYKVKEVIFVEDRGMLTPKRIEEVNQIGYKTLAVLNRNQLKDLVQRGVINADQFAYKDIVEVNDPKDLSVRYCLCKNPEREIESKTTRNDLIKKTKEALETMSTKGNEQKKCARVGKILAKYKAGKFFTWTFRNNQLEFQVDDNKVKAEENYDGCYVVRTDSVLNKYDAVKGYKGLMQIERAFRNMKTMSIEIRPIYHQLDKRIEAHVFLCMLAYYLEWQALQRLQPLFAQDGKGAQRRFSFARVVERLKSIRIQDCSLNAIKISGVISTPDKEQQKILDLLRCSQKCEI